MKTCDKYSPMSLASCWGSFSLVPTPPQEQKKTGSSAALPIIVLIWLCLHVGRRMCSKRVMCLTAHLQAHRRGLLLTGGEHPLSCDHTLSMASLESPQSGVIKEAGSTEASKPIVAFTARMRALRAKSGFPYWDPLSSTGSTHCNVCLLGVAVLRPTPCNGST